MTIKLAVLKSGEHIVSDVKEMISQEENKVVGYFLKKPCIVTMQNISVGGEDSNQMTFDISMKPWIPLAKGAVYPIAMDWIVSFVDPIDKLYNSYTEQILEREDRFYGEQSDQDYGFDQQNDADKSD